MIDNPVCSILMFLASAYLFYLWICDTRAVEKPKNAFVGTEFAPKLLVMLASLGGFLLVLIYTISENILGIASEQSSVKFWAIFSWTGAAFIEELIFRGYLCVENRGRNILILSCFAFSLLFSLIHPFLWDYSSEGGFVFKMGLAGAFSTFCIFLNSIYFYFLRFCAFNAKRSLLPCFVAHFSYNLGVFAIKLIQGFIQW